ncbi:hypothetical protein KKD61_00785 [Patescibacteria group bacterium]|nr:hypothetical protein [Patescibacteria group bacterium]
MLFGNSLKAKNETPRPTLCDLVSSNPAESKSLSAEQAGSEAGGSSSSTGRITPWSPAKAEDQGTTLVELIIYSGLLGTVLTILYLFYTQVVWQRALQVTETEIYTGGQKILFDFRQTIKGASSIDFPLTGETAGSLVLDSGNISYSLDAEGRLIKTEGAESNSLTDNRIIVESLVFGHFGPSSQSPTVKLNLVLKGKGLINGRERRENFQTAVTLP